MRTDCSLEGQNLGRKSSHIWLSIPVPVGCPDSLGAIGSERTAVRTARSQIDCWGPRGRLRKQSTMPARVVGSTERRFRGSKAIPARIAHPAGHEGEELVRPLARRRTPARREYYPHPSFGGLGR